MKLLLLAFIASFSLSAFAQMSSSRGYLYTGQKNILYYAGLIDSGTDVGFNLKYAAEQLGLTEELFNKMGQCMNRKETHAILVTQQAKKIEVILGNGQRGTSKVYRVTAINCVKAPGFLNYWRKVFNPKAN